jgi:hypothetical protein
VAEFGEIIHDRKNYITLNHLKQHILTSLYSHFNEFLDKSVIEKVFKKQFERWITNEFKSDNPIIDQKSLTTKEIKHRLQKDRAKYETLLRDGDFIKNIRYGIIRKFVENKVLGLQPQPQQLPQPPQQLPQPPQQLPQQQKQKPQQLPQQQLPQQLPQQKPPQQLPHQSQRRPQRPQQSFGGGRGVSSIKPQQDKIINHMLNILSWNIQMNNLESQESIQRRVKQFVDETVDYLTDVICFQECEHGFEHFLGKCLGDKWGISVQKGSEHTTKQKRTLSRPLPPSSSPGTTPRSAAPWTWTA